MSSNKKKLPPEKHGWLLSVLKSSFRKRYSFMFVMAFLTSCNGQVKTDLPQDSVSGSKTFLQRQPKMIKTQGSSEYQNVHCGLQDKNGNLWFGTTGEGVYHYDGKLFTQFTVKDGLSNNNVWSILEDRTGNIWFGTTDGLCRYNGKNIIRIPISGNFAHTISSNNYYNELSTENTVWSIMQDKSGKIWFGTGDGIYCYDGKIFTRFLDNENIINKDSLRLKMVDCMLEDKHGNLWFGSGCPPGMEGICRYDGKNLDSFKPKNERWIRNMIEDKNGNILFATRNKGVCSYDGKSFSFISTSPGMVLGSMMSCLEDKAGNTWLASDYGKELNDTVGGVWRYDGKNFTKFSTKDGLTNNSVFLIMEDRSGNIWMGTRNIGLYRYDGKTIASFSE